MNLKLLYLAICSLTAICGFAQELVPTPCKTPTETSFDLNSFKTTAVRNPKLDASLVALANAFAETRDNGMQFADTRGMLTDQDNDVLVEIRVNQKENRSMRQALDTMGMRIRHHNVAGLIEAWVPIDKLAEMAQTDDVYFIRPARRVDLTVGSSTTQGVAASLANTWHAGGIDGSGVVLANIDGGYTGFAARQASGDWPTGGAVTLIDTNGGGFGNGSTHGTATVEINYDMAPGATYRIYETTTVNDWYNALTNATANGVDVVSVSLGAPLDGVGDGSDCPPGFASPCGTIAEAATAARAAGVLVVNSAGNERESHWGGLYNDSAGNPGTHDWGAGNVLQSNVCLPTGYPIQATLHWDDWTNVNHDYDLLLVRLSAGGVWQQVASSTNTQNGGAGQTPQEFVTFTASGTSQGCGAGLSNYGFVVQRINAASNRNLQVFTGIPLFNPVFARSLGFPADSASVMTVAAIDQGTYAQESYSSEGPVLGPGGSLAATSIAKPNIAAYANVDTEAYGAGVFNGTSAAAPHVAGAAALVLEEFPSYSGHPDLVQDFLENCAPNLGAPGYDTQFGAGRLELCNGSFDVWTRDNSGDVGNEPYSTGSIWHSPDIKICTTQNCATSQNPEFGQTNYVYVTLRNTGPNANTPVQPAAGNIELYFSNSGGASQWPVDWTLIDSIPVTLTPNQVLDVEVPWTNVPAPGHYCMLSRWVSADDPMTFVEVVQTTTNVRNNNNISWKNFNVVNLLPMVMGNFNFAMRNIEEKEAKGVLQLQFGDGEARFLNGGGAIRINLQPEVFARWREQGGGRNLEIVGENTLRIMGNPALLTLPLKGAEVVDVDFEFEARHPFDIEGKVVNFDFEAIQLVDEQDVGGVAYGILARGRDMDTDGDRIPDVEDTDDDDDGVKDDEDADPVDPKVGRTAAKILNVNFANKTHNLGNYAEVTLIRDFDGDQVAFGVALEDTYERAQVEVHFDGSGQGTSFWIGGAEGGAQVVLENGNLTISDSTGDLLLEETKTWGPASSLVLEIGDGTISWQSPNDGGQLVDKLLFGGNNIVLSFNGDLTGASGSGVSEVSVKLIPQAPVSK